MKRFFYPLSLFVLFASTFAQAQGGCFSVVVGRKASADGTVIFGHNEDNGPQDPAGLLLIKRTRRLQPEFARLLKLAEIEPPRFSFSYLCLRMPHGPHSDVLINECGVAIASNNCPSREDKLDISHGGVGGPFLRHLVAQCASSAREGVFIAGKLVEKLGYTASGRTLVIVDGSEGWLVALVRGRRWAAAKVPEDSVALVANSYSIGRIGSFTNMGMNEKALSCIGSKDLVDYAIRRSWYDPRKGPFNFEACYALKEVRESPGNTLRVKSALLRLFPKKDFKIPPYPFALKPRRRLTVKDVAEILRDHYELLKKRKGDPHKGQPLPICRSITNSSSIFHINGDLPAQIGAVWYLSLWQPCSTPYMPIFLGINKVPEALRFGSRGSRHLPAFGPAYKKFSQVARYVREDYAKRIKEVRRHWDSYERESFEAAGLLQESLKRFFLERKPPERRCNEKIETAKEVLTRFCEGSVEKAKSVADLILQGRKRVQKLYLPLSR